MFSPSQAKALASLCQLLASDEWHAAQVYDDLGLPKQRDLHLSRATVIYAGARALMGIEQPNG